MKSRPGQTGDIARDIRAKHKQFLLPAVANYYAEPLVLDRGDGLHVQDTDGKRYLDFFGGILTIAIGHGDERITGPLKAQIDRLGHVSSLYPTVPVVELAERLAGITPGRLTKSIFQASGTEADDTGVILAQVYTGAMEIIALRHGYAGRGTLSQSLTGLASWRALPTQVPSIKHAMAPYCYRCPLGLTYPGCQVQCARDIEELIQTTTTGKIAGFLAEPIMGVGGFITPPPEYFEIAVEIIRNHGGVFICDEVQTGFGRTGRMFGIEHWGVEPEIMTMAKAIANGMPLAVTIATPEIADSFKALTISTFGGNPMSAAAAHATLDVMEQDDLPANAEAMGQRLFEGLEALKKKYPRMVGDVRGKGLMIGVELVKNEEAGDRTPDPQAVNRFLEETRERGLLVGKGGLYGNCLRIAPPLTVGRDEIDHALEICDRSLAAMKDA